MPLGGNLGMKRRHAVGDRNLLAITGRASAASMRSVNNPRRPLVVRAPNALPPDLLGGLEGHVLWPKRSVLGWVPLLGDLGVHCGQGVGDGDQTTDAEGATLGSHPVVDPALPHMIGTRVA